MSHIGELGDIKRPLSGWLSLVLFVLMIPLTNWVIMNVGLAVSYTHLTLPTRWSV